MSPATYRLLPWMRRGIGAAATAGLTVTATLNNGQIETPSLRLHGPGDILGLDPRQVLRTIPVAGSTEFEPNEFPAIEFDEPSLPWLFTPGAADADQHIAPWLCLVVVPHEVSRPVPGSPLPILRCAVAELPHLNESWAWAHVAVTGNPSTTLVDAVADAKTDLNLSRLLCPRRLTPRTAYWACVVPTFQGGRLAGLGQPVAEPLRPAWPDPTGAAEIELPVYFSWEFTTGDEGDFEAFVRRLRPAILDRSKVGVRAVDASSPGYELAGPTRLPVPGALRPLGDREPAPDSSAFQRKLRIILDKAGTAVAPPVYARSYVEALDWRLPWLAELNLDPRYRAIAALGRRVVQSQQEQLVAAAWQQAGELRRANELLRQAELAFAVSSTTHARLAAMPADLLTRVTGPVQARLLAMESQTVRATIARSLLPDTAVHASFRRAVRAGGPVARRLGGRLPPLVEPLAAGEIAAATPPRAPDGMVALDRVKPRVEAAFAASTSGAVAGGTWVDYPVSWSPPAPPALRAARPPGEWDGGEGPPEPVERTPKEQKEFIHPMALAFIRAAGPLQDHILAQRALAEPPPPPLRLSRLRASLLQALDPRATLVPRIADRLPGIVAAGLRPIAAAPAFSRGMYEPLRELAPDALLPGLEAIPADSVALLQADRAFIEAYLAGLNDELGRELRWRGFPADVAETFFRRFWDARAHVADGLPADVTEDIEPLAVWRRPLGHNGPPMGGLTFVLVRGELLRRYPTATIYAAKADAQKRIDDGRQLFPLFRATFDPDITVLAFAIDPTMVHADTGWFFVIQQHVTEPRFGLDAADAPADRPPADWSDFSWGHLVAGSDAMQALRYAPIAGSRPDSKRDEWASLTPPGREWSTKAHAGQIAAVALRRPVRLAVHASELVPKP